MFLCTNVSATNLIVQYKDAFSVKESGKVILGCNHEYYFSKKILQEDVTKVVNVSIDSIEGIGKTGKYCFPSSGNINFQKSDEASEINQKFHEAYLGLENMIVYNVSRGNNPPIKNILSNDAGVKINLTLNVMYDKQPIATLLNEDLRLVQDLDEKFQNSIDFLNEKEKNLIESIEENNLNSEKYILNFTTNNHNTIDIKKDTDIKCSLYSASNLDLIFVLYDNVKLTFSGFNNLLNGKIKFFLYNKSSIIFNPDSFFGTDITFKSMRSFIDQTIREELPTPIINFAINKNQEKPFIINAKTLSFKDVQINRTAEMELSQNSVINIDNIDNIDENLIVRL